MKKRNTGTYAAAAAVGGVAWLIIILSISAICAFFLTPYLVEQWAAWCGKIVVIEWWKGFIIYVVFGILSRNAAAGVCIAMTLLTLILSWVGFGGFV